MRVWRHVLCAVGIFAGQAGAQQRLSPVEKPDDVVRRFLVMLDSARFVDAARLLQLDGVVRMRDHLLESHRRPHPVRWTTVEDLLKADPEMPRAVAEYQVSRMTREGPMSMAQYIGFEFANVFDTLALKQMSALELGARWLEAKDQRYQSRRQRMMDPGCRTLTPAEIAQLDLVEAQTIVAREVLGAIVRGDSALVLHRPHGESFGETGTETFLYGIVMMVRRQSWQILPTRNFLTGPNVMWSSGCRSP